MRIMLVMWLCTLVACGGHAGDDDPGGGDDTSGGDDGPVGYCSDAEAPEDCFCQEAGSGSYWKCATCEGAPPAATDRCTPTTEVCTYAQRHFLCDCTCNEQGYHACDHNGLGGPCPRGDYPAFSVGMSVVANGFPIGGRAPAISSDGLELVFARFSGDYPPAPGAKLELWTTRRAAAGDPWGPIVRELALTTTSGETDPMLSADGRRLLFVRGDGTMQESTRATPASAWSSASPIAELAGFQSPHLASDTQLYLVREARVYVTTRAAVGQPWAAPTLVADAPGNARSVTLSADGLEMLVGTTTGGVVRTIRASPTSPFVPAIGVAMIGEVFGAPPALVPYEPALGADGATLYFAFGDTLHVATRP